MSRNIIPTYSLLVLFLMSLCLILSNAEFQCADDVLPNLIPCQGFLMSGDPSPSVGCCSGAQTIDKQYAATDHPGRVAICSCLKAAEHNLPINVEKAAMLPALCNLKTIKTIDPNVDCSKA